MTVIKGTPFNYLVALPVQKGTFLGAAAGFASTSKKQAITHNFATAYRIHAALSFTRMIKNSAEILFRGEEEGGLVFYTYPPILMPRAEKAGEEKDGGEKKRGTKGDENFSISPSSNLRRRR